MDVGVEFYYDLTWAVHRDRKRLNICDGSDVNINTVLKNPRTMHFDTFLDYVRTTFIDGATELCALLKYISSKNMNLHDRYVIVLDMPIKQHLRFCTTPTIHEEDWIVAIITNRLFILGQTSDILD